MKLAWVIALVATACDSGKPPGAKTGSASARPAPSCTLDGVYRLRYFSNGVDGWWMTLQVAQNKATLVGKDVMLDLKSGPIATVADPIACTLKLTAKSQHAGDVAMELHPVADGTVTGHVSRTLNGDKTPADTQTLNGWHEATPPVLPGCLKPGVYELATADATKWKLVEGEPRGGLGCTNDFASKLRVRVTVAGGQIFVDENGGDDGSSQSFARGVVKRDGDCKITLSYDVEFMHLPDAHLTFAGDKLTGTVDDMTYSFMEDGTAGENLWKCDSKHVALVGTRVGD